MRIFNQFCLTLFLSVLAVPLFASEVPAEICTPPNDVQDTLSFSLYVQSLQHKRDLLWLVDTEYRLPENYRPSDMQTVQFTNLPKKVVLRPEAMAWLKKMVEAAKKDGINLRPISSFRSYQYQTRLAHGRTDNQIAQPGHSQHQLGTAVDFNSVEQKDEHIKPFQWLKAHASEYGFSLSFPKGQEKETGYAFEPWHYRYISKEAVEFQNRFFHGSQHKMLKFLNSCLWSPKDPALSYHTR